MNQEFEFENRTVSMYLHRWFETPITDTANVYNVCSGTRLEWLLTNGDQLRSRLFTMRSLARTPEEHAALQETEKRATSWIRWLLEQNREKIRLYQQQGVKDSRLFVMLDPQGSPRDAAFEGFAEELSPENGKPGCVPRYTDGCMPRFCYDFQEALQDRPLFDAWLPPELPEPGSRAETEPEPEIVYRSSPAWETVPLPEITYSPSVPGREPDPLTR